MAIILLGAGHRPAGLGGRTEPRDWRAATQAVAAHLTDRLAREGAVEALVVPDDGFGLMLGGAVQMLRNAGAPIGLRVLLPFASHADWLATETAAAWHARIQAKADQVEYLSPARPSSLGEADALRLAAYDVALARADQVLVCWNGTHQGTTWAVYDAACRAGLMPINLYGDVAASLGLTWTEVGTRVRVARAPGSPAPHAARAPWFGLRVD